MSGRAGRYVVERVFVTGTLVLETPAHFGNGDADGLTDMPLLRDMVDSRKALLTGSSIAGALRSYLREYEQGYNANENPLGMAENLFGRVEGEASYQSWLMVDDALGECQGTELRDGVCLDPKTRTAMDKKKFDLELLRAGTTFNLSFELLLTERNSKLLEALALALQGLERGEIGLGLRKRRGLGQCSVKRWGVRRFRVDTSRGLIDWLSDEPEKEVEGERIVELLGVRPSLMDKREMLTIEAELGLEGSMLIRSGSGRGDSPDMVHLMSYRPKGNDIKPVISGTSLAGALRARALRIANTLFRTGGGEGLVDGMFGKRIGSKKDEPVGSRVVARESMLNASHDRVQSRIKINRFTGGAFPGALFSQQPVFGGSGRAVTLHLTLRKPGEAEVGLLLLVLKDLWTGDLPLGGESSVGRGRLRGGRATIAWSKGGQVVKEWQLKQLSGRLECSGSGTMDELEVCVQALGHYGRDT